MKEQWKPVKGFEGKYIVSNFGNVMSIPRTYTDKLGREYTIDGFTLTKQESNAGYENVFFGSSISKSVHRLVAEAFVPNPNGFPEVNHIDGDKKNNCAGYEGKYVVSNLGNVMSLPRTYVDKDGSFCTVDGMTLTKTDDTRGYDRVSIGKNKQRRVHRLVAEAFIPNPLNLPEVNHKDGNKKNNCVTNLEWVTHQGNVVHAVETGLFGERAKKATPEIVTAIRAEYIPYDRKHSTIALGRKYGIDPAYVWRIINGQKRKRIQ